MIYLTNLQGHFLPLIVDNFPTLSEILIYSSVGLDFLVDIIMYIGKFNIKIFPISLTIRTLVKIKAKNKFTLKLMIRQTIIISGKAVFHKSSNLVDSVLFLVYRCLVCKKKKI